MTNINEIVTKHKQKGPEHIIIPITITLSAFDQTDAHFSVKGISSNPMLADCVLSIKTVNVCN